MSPCDIDQRTDLVWSQTGPDQHHLTYLIVKLLVYKMKATISTLSGTIRIGGTHIQLLCALTSNIYDMLNK